MFGIRMFLAEGLSGANRQPNCHHCRMNRFHDLRL
jgi:hypothetical protein